MSNNSVHHSLSTLSKNIAEHLSGDRERELERKRQLLLSLHDMLDRQFQAFSRNDQKCSAIITIDVAVLSGILLLIGYYGDIGIVALTIMGISFVSLTGSFLICLIHSMPRGEAGIGNANDNPRVFAYIVRYSREEYYGRIRDLSIDDLIQSVSFQISGMTRNNIQGHRLIRGGVMLTIVGVVALASAVPFIVLLGVV